MIEVTDGMFLVSANELKAMLNEVVKEALASAEKEKPMAAQSYYTVKEATALLKVTRATLDRWELKGTLVPYRVGRSVRYRVEDVQRMMKGGQP